MASLKSIQGIGTVYKRKLAKANIQSTDTLLKVGATRKGRRELQKQTGISQKLILEWVNHADLFRVKGIGGQYADLLEEAGVDTVPELATRKANALLATMRQKNDKKNLVNRTPTEKDVKKWITAAKRMKRVVEY